MTTMVDYVNKLSGDSFDNFENIIIKQYRKFNFFYHLVSPFSNLISDLHYTFNSATELDVILVFDNSDNKKHVNDMIAGKINKGNIKGSIKSKKTTLDIKLILDEN